MSNLSPATHSFLASDLFPVDAAGFGLVRVNAGFLETSR